MIRHGTSRSLDVRRTTYCRHKMRPFIRQMMSMISNRECILSYEIIRSSRNFAYYSTSVLKQSNNNHDTPDNDPINTSIKNASTSSNTKTDRPISLQFQRMQQQDLRRQLKRKQLQQQQSQLRQQLSRQSYDVRSQQQQHPQTNMKLQHDPSVQPKIGSNSSSATQISQQQQQNQNLTSSEMTALINKMHKDLLVIIRELGTDYRHDDSIIIDSDQMIIRARPKILITPVWDDHDDTIYNHHESHHSKFLQQQQIESIFHRTIAIQMKLKVFVELRFIRPGTIHRHEFVALLGYLLHIYSCLAGNLSIGDISTQDSTNEVHPSNDMVFQQTMDLIDFTQRSPIMIDLSHRQCYAAITVAAKCQEWKMAAQLFTQQIDPEQVGYVPVPFQTWSDRMYIVSGLYCIARAAIESQTLPVENVLDGITKLTMNSPYGTENYVLAAGIALGYAGEWEALKEYLKTSYKASQLGQPLVAATMHACLLCHRHEEVIEIFRDLVQGELASASEWQWKWKKDTLHPACRDLAIRALGELKTVQNTNDVKEKIMELYREAVNESANISIEAFYAIVAIWDDDVDTILNLILPMFESKRLSGFVCGNDTQITWEPSTPSTPSHEFIYEVQSLTDLVMQICNSNQKFGLALLCFRLFEVSIVQSKLLSNKEWSDMMQTKEQRQHTDIVQTILPFLSVMKNSKDILTTVMVSLCGVKLPNEAINLYDAFVSYEPAGIPREAHNIYEYAKFLRSNSDSSSYHSWETAHRHIHRLTGTFATISMENADLKSSDAIILSSALSEAIRECTATSNPEAGIFLGRWVESQPLPRKFNPIFSDLSNGTGLTVQFSDSLLAAVIEAFAQSGNVRFAEHLVRSNLGEDRPPAKWLLSYHEVMKMFFLQGQSSDGLAVFRNIIPNAKNPSLFCTMAKSMIASGNWRQVIDLYRQAISSGCASEELSLLTMESIAASGRIGQIDGQFPLLRSIISETSKFLGLSPTVWIETNYWKFKRILGFSSARLIMGWDDYKLSRLDELNLAIETLERRSAAGLTPKNPALFAIVQAAANNEQYSVPFNATGLPKVPRNVEEWNKILNKVLDEAKETRLLFEPNFIFEVSLALRRVGRHAECLGFVLDAMHRGIRLNKGTLENAVLAGQAAGIEDATVDIKLLLEGP